jgi:uncharacterized SAM-binding protein YcdF (DUF218 family)
MFALKSVLSSLLVPLPIALAALAVGVALLWFTRRQRAGKVLVTVGFGLLTLFSLPVVGNALLAPLEAGQLSLYPAERLAAATAQAGRKPRWIVALGAAHSIDARFPATDQLSAGALSRLSEAIRLYRALPGTKLLVSGASAGPYSHAQVLAQAAVALGVPESDLVLENTTVDTEDEAVKLGAVVGKDDFILVTSATHMPRALGIFRARGLDPIPSPTNHVGLHDPNGLQARELWPQPGSLGRSHAAFHEYIGRIWSRLRGKL